MVDCWQYISLSALPGTQDEKHAICTPWMSTRSRSQRGHMAPGALDNNGGTRRDRPTRTDHTAPSV